MSSKRNLPTDSVVNTKNATDSFNNIQVEADGVIFVPKGFDLPPRCIVCNDMACQPIETINLRKHSFWKIFPLKKFPLSIGKCSIHQEKPELYKYGKYVWFLGICLNLGAANVLFRADNVAIKIVAIIVIFLGALLMQRSDAVIKVMSIKKQGIRVKGFGEAFLQSLR